jgi:hypothetical protein
MASNNPNRGGNERERFTPYNRKSWSSANVDKHREFIRTLAPIQVLRLCITLGVTVSDKLPDAFVATLRGALWNLELLLSALDQFIQERNLRHVRDGPKKPSYATDVQTAYTLFLRLASHLEHDNLARLVLGKDSTYSEFLTFVKALLITLEFDKTSSIPTDYPHGRTVHDGSGRYLTRSQVMLPSAGPFPPLPLYPPLPAPQLPIPQLPAPQMGNPGFFTPTTGNLPWASEALRNAALGQSAFRNTAPGSTEAGNAGAGNVGPGNATSGTSATRSTGARSKTSRSATSGGANSGSAASRSAAPMSNEALGSKFSNECFLPPFDIPFLFFNFFVSQKLAKKLERMTPNGNLFCVKNILSS